MADNVRLSKEELDALLGGEVITPMNTNNRAEEASAAELRVNEDEHEEQAANRHEVDSFGDVDEDSPVVQRLLQAVHALHARVELLEGQVRELRLQSVSPQTQQPGQRPAPPSKPAPRPPAPPPTRTEPTLSRVERYGRGRS
ncbi:hypothetical protein [Paenibacillus daejeonensis]|uniref:hypothetical protein n=1 Tax=Paenibacillus daejeonensis TaxID=135193 RepID=UPI00035E5E0E|nr:hypothetical protein [Paenibacillus daejeonensis]